jgi:plastocyanin
MRLFFLKPGQAICVWSLALLTCCAYASSEDVDVSATVAWANSSKAAKRHTTRDVVAWLTPISPATPVAVPARSGLQLVQRNKSFDPHLLVIPVGSVVQFPNRDPFFHNVFSLFEGKRFDLGLYEAGSTRNVHFDKPGVSFIFCNIHSEMSAVIIALATPYYSTSDSQGKILIPHVPIGRYRLHLWYEAALPEELEAQSRDVVVSTETASLGTLRLKLADLPKTHANKYGKEYEPPAPGNPAYIQP